MSAWKTFCAVLALSFAVEASATTGVMKPFKKGGEEQDNYNVWDHLELTDQLVERVQSAKVWRLPRMPQDPQLGKCGWHSLAQSMTPFYLSGRNRFKPIVDGKNSLWEDAKRMKAYTHDDGRTMPWHLTKVAKYWGYEAHWGWYLHDRATLKKIVEKLRDGWGVLLTVRGTNRNGMPIKRRWIGGHWVSVEGVINVDSKLYLIIKDPWPSDPGPKKLDESNLWPIEEFYDASNYRAWIYFRSDT